jgi:adenylate cyclase
LTTQTAPAASLTEIKPTNRAILLIDVAGSLKITRQLGDARAYHCLRFLTETIKSAGSNKGHVIRSLGDGFLLAFDSVEDALSHAVTAQSEVARCNPTEVPFKIRCGIHHGSVIEADGDMFGVAVYLASRVTGYAQGGEILLTGEALEQCERDTQLFKDFGPTLLPGFEEPVRLYEYPWA